jgi:transcriptional regulator with XRE-family HTH domain
VSVEVVKRFGQKIRQLRIERDWSQELLAEKADMHRNYVGMVERGERNPSLRQIERFAVAFGVNIKDLFE